MTSNPSPPASGTPDAHSPAPSGASPTGAALADAPLSDPDRLPRHTTPTWEVELLISGVAVFAMLQLPGWLDDVMFALQPRLDAHWGELLLMLYLYLKSAAVILAVTFVLHLLLRAHWIALVGMHSVHPDGVRWDRLRLGPVQRAIEQHRHLPTEVAIERADNRATTVFALGVTLATILVVITLVLGLGFAAVNGAAALAGQRVRAPNVLLALFALVMLPFGLLVSLDRRFGRAWPEGGRRHRVAARLFRAYARIGLGRGNNRVLALMASHGGDRRMVLITAALMMTALFAVLFVFHGMRDGQSVGNYALFPRDAADELVAAHYDDQRDPARDPAMPFVQSMVATGPYLRLTVPYQPRRDGPALARTCSAATGQAAGTGTSSFHLRVRIPDAAAAAAAGENSDRVAAANARLACLQALHPVTLDGQPLPGLHYDAGSDARTDRPALQAMIDVRGLAPGRHVLQVAMPPKAGIDGDEGDDEGADGDRIVFWR